jgi:excisionase family DNA binding protein
MKDFHTVNELANVLKVPKSWVYARTRETGPGSIPRIKVGKYLRFEINKVLDWLRETDSNDLKPL